MDNIKLLTEAQIKAVEELAEAIAKVVDWMVEFVKTAAKAISEWCITVLKNYPNKRVVHLALHHKDLRVRKKNRNRIVEWLRRYIRCRG